MLIGDQLAIVREEISRKELQFENVDHNAIGSAYDFVKSLSAPRSVESRGNELNGSRERMHEPFSMPSSIGSKLSRLSSGNYNDGNVDQVIRAPFDMDYNTMIKTAVI